MGEGHNHVRSIFERWRRLEEGKVAISDDLKELFLEAKSAGFDTKALRLAFREAVKAENETPRDRELAALVDSYMAALTGTAVATQARITRDDEQASGGQGDSPVRPGTTASSGSAAEEIPEPDGGQKKSVSSAPDSAIEFEDSASDASRAPSTPSGEEEDIPEFLRRAQ